MNWIDINENLINLKFVKAIIKEDREASYAEPFLLVFNIQDCEYYLSFKTRKAREEYRLSLLGKLKK